MNRQQPPNGNWNANGSSEDTLRAARLTAQRNGALGQQLTLNEQLALHNIGLAGGAATGNHGFPNYASAQTGQQGLFPSQGFGQGQMGGGLQGQGLSYGSNGNAGGYGKVGGHFPAQAAVGANSFPTNQQNTTALIALLQQQMLNFQQNGGFQNSGQASLVSNNLAQALALAQQQSSSNNTRMAASLANNPTALNAYLYRLSQQQQALTQNQRQMNLNQINAAQLLQQQALQQQMSQLQAMQQQQQVNANMATLLKNAGGSSTGFADSQMLGASAAAHANQGMNLAGFNSTGLANTPLASAPLLPILGTDLAKPSQRGLGHEGLTAAQLPLSAPGSDVAKQMEALSFGSSINRPGSAVSQNEASGRSQAMSPTGAQQKDINKGGSHVLPTSAAQLNLVQTQGTTTATSPSAGSRDRDLTTLKTLGQMLAKTDNTVENAVQNGLLGGCNAEDVKIVWEAYVMELATSKQHEAANRAFQKQGAELVARRAKSNDPEATKLLLDAAKAPPASVPRNLSEALQCLGMDALSTPPNPAVHQHGGTGHPKPVHEKQDVATAGAAENDSGWDGVIENEHDYVPHHLIDEVNTPNDHPTNIEIPKEEAFNAINYGFFAVGDADDGLADCPLEDTEDEKAEDMPLEAEAEDSIQVDVCRERTKSEENNNITADDDWANGTTSGPVNASISPDSVKSDSEQQRSEMKNTEEMANASIDANASAEPPNSTYA